MGTGKSWMGNVFMKALLGPLWGTASPKILDGDFSIAPFKDRMFTFIDEAKFNSQQGVDEIKKLIRSVDVPGVEKFQDGRTYRIFSRLMFAANRFDMRISQADVRDRAIFYTRAYDREFLGVTEPKFEEWARGLKPFFTEFDEFLRRREVREHYMRMLMDREVTKDSVENTEHSSGADSTIASYNVSWARRVAKFIIEDARIHEDMDIVFPFTRTDLNRRTREVAEQLGMNRVQGDRVLAEFDSADVIERIVINRQRKYRFRYGLGKVTRLFGEATSLQMEPSFEFSDADEGDNECDGTRPVPWRGAKAIINANGAF